MHRHVVASLICAFFIVAAIPITKSNVINCYHSGVDTGWCRYHCGCRNFTQTSADRSPENTAAAFAKTIAATDRLAAAIRKEEESRTLLSRVSRVLADGAGAIMLVFVSPTVAAHVLAIVSVTAVMAYISLAAAFTSLTVLVTGGFGMFIAISIITLVFALILPRNSLMSPLYQPLRTAIEQ